MARQRTNKNNRSTPPKATATPSRKGLPRRLLAAAVAVALLSVLLLVLFSGRFQKTPDGASRTSGAGSPSGPPGIQLSLLLITLDTTRADRIGAYGYTAIETPNLDRLAGEGVLFEQAESVAPLTLPAHSSIFTGQFPPAHGVRDNGGFYLDEEQVVLAEMLRDSGFRTGGFVASFVLDSKWGIAQGFDTYFDDFDLRKTSGRSIGEIERPASESSGRRARLPMPR